MHVERWVWQKVLTPVWPILLVATETHLRDGVDGHAELGAVLQCVAAKVLPAVVTDALRPVEVVWVS